MQYPKGANSGTKATSYVARYSGTILGDGTSARRMLTAAAVLLYQSSELSLTLFFGLSDFAGERFVDLLEAK